MRRFSVVAWCDLSVIFRTDLLFPHPNKDDYAEDGQNLGSNKEQHGKQPDARKQPHETLEQVRKEQEEQEYEERKEEAEAVDDVEEDNKDQKEVVGQENNV